MLQDRTKEKGLPRVRSTDDVVPIEGRIEKTEKRDDDDSDKDALGGKNK